MTIMATGKKPAKPDLLATLPQGVLLSGVIEFGSRRAQLIGLPTANISIATTAIVPEGVYATLASVKFDDDSRTYPSLSYVSRNPGCDLPEICFYTHLFGFFCDIYGRRVTFKALHFIRTGKVAVTSEAARARILDDIAMARSYFADRDGICVH